jgi:alpha-glucosidase
MVLSLRGTPVLYQGDEIGLEDVSVAHEDMRDPLGVAYWPAYAGRDAMRTPMPWRDAPSGGFTAPGARPWLPLGPTAPCNVEQQRSDPSSMLTLARDLIVLRRDTPDLQTGRYETLPAPAGVWAWRRGAHTLVALNLSDDDAALEGASGRVRIATDRGRDGELFEHGLSVAAWEAVIAEVR